MAIEDFGLAENLMITCGIEQSGGFITQPRRRAPRPASPPSSVAPPTQPPPLLARQSALVAEPAQLVAAAW